MSEIHTGSALLDELIARRRAIRKRWRARPPLLAIAALPKQRPKSVEERLAEARALHGKLPKQKVDDIVKCIRESAIDFGEVVRGPLRPYRSNAHKKIDNAPTNSAIQHVVADHYKIEIIDLVAN